MQLQGNSLIFHIHLRPFAKKKKKHSASLEEVTRVAQLTADHLLSVGAALSHVKIPHHTIADSQSDEYLVTERLGAETGRGERQKIGSHKIEVDLPRIVKGMLGELLDWRDEDRSFSLYTTSDEIILMINNLGGLSGLELSAITLDIALQLENTYGIKPVRVFSGTFMSTLNELGFSISLLKVVDLGLGDGMGMLELLDTPAETTGWANSIRNSTWKKSKLATFKEDIYGEEFVSRTGLPTLESEISR